MGSDKPFFVMCLEKELFRRIDDNKQYSLRAFAKYLEVDASLLSKILQRKKMLPLKHSQAIADKLSLNQDDRAQFIISIAEEQKCRSLKKVDNHLTDCDDKNHYAF